MSKKQSNRDKSELLKAAIKFHRDGDLPRAEEFYNRVVTLDPNQADANHNLGVILKNRGQYDDAIQHFLTAFERLPSEEQYWNSLISLARARLQKLKAQKTTLQEINVADHLPDYCLSSSNDFSLDRAIRFAIRKSKEKNFSEARLVYLQILQRFPKNRAASAALSNLPQGSPISHKKLTSEKRIILGRVKRLFSEGKFHELLDALIPYTDEYAADEELMIYKVAAYLSAGKLREGFSACEDALSKFPLSASLHNNHGLILKQLGKVSEAKASFINAVSCDNHLAPAFHNLANSYSTLGKFDCAIKLYTLAKDLDQSYFDPVAGLGAAMLRVGKYNEAIAILKHAHAMKADPWVLNNMGNAYQEIGLYDLAIESYKFALNLQNDPDFMQNLSNAYFGIGDLKNALILARSALEKSNKKDVIIYNVMSQLEKLNELDLVSEWNSIAALHLNVIPASISVIEARLNYRKNDFSDAVRLLNGISVDELKHVKEVKLYYETMARSLDRMGRFDEAFYNFSRMNDFAKTDIEYDEQAADAFYQAQHLKLDMLQNLGPQSNQKYAFSSDDDGVQLVFMIGFPRSGTTLLDTILRSHSQIQVYEELNALEQVKQAMEKIIGFDLNNPNVDFSVIKAAREKYFNMLQVHEKLDSGTKIVIDKLPLNILELQFIKFLFPDAKFILSLRHPLDCILSCWMQNFRLNSSMSNFTDLTRTFEFYDVSFKLYIEAYKRLNLSVYSIKYEDLVSDVKGSVVPLLKYLELDWEPSLLNYVDTAKKRKRINTPSYSQVTQELYSHSTYRWKGYWRYLKTHSDVIADVARRLDYEID